MWLEFYSFFNCTCSGARGSRLIDRTCKSITHCFSKRLHGWFIESVFFLSDEHSTDFWVFFYIHCSASSCSTRLEIALRPVRRERTLSCFVLLCVFVFYAQRTLRLHPAICILNWVTSPYYCSHWRQQNTQKIDKRFH